MIVSYYDAVREIVGIDNMIGGNINGPMSKIEFVEGFTDLPTEEQIQSKMSELQADYDSKQYQRDRKLEYPTIEELVVALYDEDDKQAIIEKRNAVKAKYPKPE